jgi:hypothetical protein
MDFSVNVSVAAGDPGSANCNVISTLLRVWLPDSNGTTATCASQLPFTFSTCIPFLQAGGAASSFNVANTPSLRYTVRHIDEINNPLFNPAIATSFPKIVKAKACACGTSQTTFTNPATNEREITAPVLHPAIQVVKSANVTSLCEGVSTAVTYSYAVTNPGDVDLENITVTDDHCGPVNPVLNGVFNSGDVNQNNRLDRAGPTGETWHFTCSTNISTTTTNIATANGTDFILQIPVSDTDTITIPANPKPVCSINPTSSCDPAASITAQGNTCGPYTCTWTKNGAPFNVGNTSCTITATGPGVYCAVVTECNGCKSNEPGDCCATVTTGPVCNDSDISEPTPPIDTCGDNVQHCITAVVGNTTPATTYAWTVTSGACTIQGASDQLQVCFLIPSGSCTLQIVATTPGCAQTATCTKTVECPAGGQGRTPGFWKQEQHFGYWAYCGYCPTKTCAGCAASTKFCDVFNCGGSCAAAHAAYDGKSLLQVLQQGGGGFKALGRHAVAALLNSCVPSDQLDYPLNTQEVKDLVNAAIANCSPDAAHTLLAGYNELEGGNFGHQCYCGENCNTGLGASFNADLNRDGKINLADLNFMLSKWGTNDAAADIDHNGNVGPHYMALLLNSWTQ